MLETPHSILGAAVGAATGNPYAAAGTGFGSHLAGDILPHWNPQFPFHSRTLYAFVIADFVVAEALVILFWVLFPTHPEIAVGAFFGTVPDIILGLRFLFKIRQLQWYERAHSFIHNEVSMRYGIPPQVAVVALSIWYLVSF